MVLGLLRCTPVDEGVSREYEHHNFKDFYIILCRKISLIHSIYFFETKIIFLFLIKKMALTSSNVTSGFIDLATFDEIEKYLYGGPDATA